jgi:dolichol-phosphate mannosyltransferase
VITPTFNEAQNVGPLIDLLEAALVDVDHEILVVDDDSPDRTWEVAEAIAERVPAVKVIRRFSSPGLSQAVLAGMEVARGEVLAVIDADMQHDETRLPAMVKLITSGEADVVVGSRAAEGGSYGDWSKPRRFVSWVATMIAQVLLRVPVTDPMSGFFAISRETYRRLGPTINPQGFKILLEFVGRRNANLRIREVGFTFRNRTAGETKMSPSVIRSYLLAVFELRLGRQLKPQFVMYCLVGISGFVVNLAVFALAEAFDLGAVDIGLDRKLRWSLILGIVASILWNFALHNTMTFYEHRFRGIDMIRGLLLFTVVSAIGILIHVAIFQFLESTGWGTGVLRLRPARLLHDAIGMLVALFSNYFLNMNAVWRTRPRRSAITA